MFFISVMGLKHPFTLLILYLFYFVDKKNIKMFVKLFIYFNKYILYINLLKYLIFL